MEAIATVTASAAVVCFVSLVAIIWNHAKRMDEVS